MGGEKNRQLLNGKLKCIACLVKLMSMRGQQNTRDKCMPLIIMVQHLCTEIILANL